VNFLSQKYSNGNWTWADLGLPPGANFIRDPSAVTYQGADGIQYIAVFARSDADDLVVDHWDGGQWVWDDLSAEAGPYWGFTPVAKHPIAITYLDQYGNRQIRVFYVDDQQYLWASSCATSCVINKGNWQGGQWQFDQITNQISVGNRIVDWPTAAHFIDSSGIGRTYVFTESTDTQGNSNGTIDAFFSEDDYQSGVAYEWWDLGSPDFNSVMAPVALTQDLPDGVLQEYPPPPCPTFHVFAFGTSTQGLFDNLGCRDTFFNYGNGGSYWANDGLPPQLGPNGQILTPTAVSYIDPLDFQSRYHVFVSGSDGHLYRAFWKNEGFTSAAWFDQGLPPNSSSADEPSIVAFAQAGQQRIYAFSQNFANQHLVVNSCMGTDMCDGLNGQSSSWADQGTM